jgi:hypothetical protein
MGEAYNLGRFDYCDGRSRADNRFMVGSSVYAEWDRGWLDAVRADPLIDQDERGHLLASQPH